MGRPPIVKRQAPHDAPKFEPVSAQHPLMTIHLIQQILPDGIPIPPDVLLRIGEMLRSHSLPSVGLTLAEETQRYINVAILRAQEIEKNQAIVTAALAAAQPTT